MKFGRFLTRNQREDRPYVSYNEIKECIKIGINRDVFVTKLTEEISRVNDFYTSHVECLGKRVSTLESAQNAKELHFLVSSLRVYMSLNQRAVTKIVKKFNKVSQDKVEDKTHDLRDTAMLDTLTTLIHNYNSNQATQMTHARSRPYFLLLPLLFVFLSPSIALTVILAITSAYFITKSIKRNPYVISRKMILLTIPTNIISRIWGKVHHITLPVWMRKPLFLLWSVAFHCNLNEMRYPLESYTCLGEFFGRPLLDDCRPVDPHSNLVSPVDGKVVSCGQVTSKEGLQTLEQIKGLDYSLSAFLGDSDHISTKKLYHMTIYLSPGDYHRIHSPADWNITRRKHFPGALLPVNPIAVKFLRGLFAMNERVVLEGQWTQEKYFALVAVGALNVGSVALNFDTEVQTNYHHSMVKSSVDYFLKSNCTIDLARPDLDKTMSNPYGANTTYDRTYPNSINMERGEELGRFKLGSTVVLVFESDHCEFAVKPGQKVTMGQKIIQ